MKQISLWDFVRENIHIQEVPKTLYQGKDTVDKGKIREIENGYGRVSFISTYNPFIGPYDSIRKI